MLDMEKRLTELAKRSYFEQRFYFTDFLNISELASYYLLKDVKREVGFADSEAFGGSEGCERCLVRFGSPEQCGYEEAYPIVLLKISPVQAKFADKLSHRDILGSVIGLGLEREKLGDIYLRDNVGYIFVLDTVSDYIIANLSFVKHTKVNVILCENIPDEVKPHIEEKNVIVSSNRIDGIIAKLYNLSREESLNLFREGKVFLNGREISSNAKPLSEGDKVSVRGYGKFVFQSEGGITRKNKLYVNIGVYS